MNYRSVDDLNHAIMSGLPLVPRDVDLIVGIPRSGLLAATVLALYLNLPLTDLQGLVDRRMIQSGKRRDSDRTKTNPFADVHKVLVLDDSVRSGSAMAKARAQLEAADLGFEIIFGAVFVTPDSCQVPDLYFEIVPLPRMFGWNLMHHAWLANCCASIDGVLCQNPEPDETADEASYRAFIENAKPFCLPTVPVGTLITERPKQYRDVTEAWLQRHDVSYDRLIMFDGDEAAEISVFKGNAYAAAKGMLFVEGDPGQAPAIAERAARPVVCAATQEMHYPTSLTANAALLARKLGRPWRMRLQRATQNVVDRLLDRSRA